MDIIGLAETIPALIGGAYRAGKGDDFVSTISALAPLAGAGFNAGTLAQLHRSGSLVKTGTAIATLSVVLDAILKADPTLEPKVTALCVALGMKPTT